MHRPPPSPQPSQKDNNPSLRTTLSKTALSLAPHHILASLVKGRWLDGKAQTVALLRPACDMSALFILQTFLPSRRRDCLSCIDPLHPHNPRKRTIIPRSAPPFQKPRYPSLRTTTLASLVKGELLLLSFAQPTIEGLPHQTLSSPQPFQKDNNPSPHVYPFIQYINHSPVCSPAHSSVFGTASPQGRCKVPK